MARVKSLNTKDDNEKQSKVFSELLTISFLMSMALTIVYLIVIFCFNYFNADKQLYVTATLSVFLSFTTIDWLYTGLEQFKMIAIRSVAVKLISLILLYVFVKNSTDVLIYLYIGIFSSVANNAYNLLTVKSKVKFTTKNLLLSVHIKPLLLIFGLSIATSMYTLLDVVLLGFLSDAKAVGLYSAAVKLTKIVIPFVISLSSVALPKMAHLFATNNYAELKPFLAKSLHFILFFSIPCCFGLALLAPEFITLFSGKQFLEAALSMKILSFLPVFIGLGYFWGFQILIAAGKDKEMFYAVVLGMIVAVVLNIILVPGLKDVGAAVSNSATELVVTLAYVYFVKKHYRFSFKWSVAIKSIVASMVFVPIIVLSRQLHLNSTMHLVISVVACATVYVLIQWKIFRDHLVKELYAIMLSKFKISTQITQS